MCSSSADVRHHSSSDFEKRAPKFIAFNILNWDEARREVYEGIILYSNSVKEGFYVLYYSLASLSNTYWA